MEKLGRLEQIIANNQLTLEKFDIVKFAPCRFIGKSVYARGFQLKGSGEIFRSLKEQSAWIFDLLDELKEYATDETNDAALLTWDKYCDKTGLLGFTVGRFMKADTPVPIADTSPSDPETDMDYFDLPETYIAKGWLRGKMKTVLYHSLTEKLVYDEIERQGYKPTQSKFMAEIYPKQDDENNPIYGFYMPCDLENSK